MTQDELDRKSVRKQQLETEAQGTTEQRRQEIDKELAEINRDLDAHRRETSAPAQSQQQPVRERNPRTDAPGT